MKIHCLTFAGKSPSDSYLKAMDLLKESAKKRGHELEIILSRDCQLDFLGKKPQLLINGKKVTQKKIKSLIVRATFNGSNLDLHIGTIKQFQLAGIDPVNNYKAVINVKNKVRALQVLNSKKIPIPRSYVVRSSEYIDQIVDDHFKYPVIIKSLSGCGGIGVAICESRRSLCSVIELLLRDENSSGPLIIQEYIKESSGKDIRIFVVGNQIVAAMERMATKKGEFRSNFSMGGKVKIASLSDQEKKIALAASKACGLDFSGVDLIRTKNGPKILEVNANPGLEGITLATGIDVAGKIIDYAVAKYKKNGKVKKKVRRILKRVWK